MVQKVIFHLDTTSIIRQHCKACLLLKLSHYRCDPENNIAINGLAKHLSIIIIMVIQAVKHILLRLMRQSCCNLRDSGS